MGKYISNYDELPIPNKKYMIWYKNKQMVALKPLQKS